MNVLVFGQGKSGTTVVAKTIQHSLPGAGFLMEPKSEEEIARKRARPLVTKILYGQWKEDLPGLTRMLRNEGATRFDRIVKMLRDPRDQAISSFLYNFYNITRSGRASEEQLQEMIGLVRAKEENPQALSFGRLCGEMNCVMRWKGYSIAWLLTESPSAANRAYWEFLASLGRDGFLLRYEDFMRGELRALESYLGLELSRRREVDEYERTRRSAAAGNWREFFTPEDVEVLRPLIGAALGEMGYEDWELRPVSHLNPAHFSEYLLRLVREARCSEQ